MTQLGAKRVVRITNTALGKMQFKRIQKGHIGYEVFEVNSLESAEMLLNEKTRN